MPISPTRLAALAAKPNHVDFSNIKRGVEKESLRITGKGLLAQSPHPLALGSALTHQHITTDFSEALLEFITSPSNNIDTTLKQLDQIHRYTYQNIDGELLWVNSMPCALLDDGTIPVAQYGSSHVAQMKTVYRLGLGHRYGRAMQTIAGIHFNFSLPDEFWLFLQELDKNNDDLKTFRTQGYLHLIRNFRRYFWLLLYLFGASPAICPTFVQGRKHNLSPLGKNGESLHGPFATSLRMGDLGYQSNAQQSIAINYNSLSDYLMALCGAITRPHSAYEDIGLRDANDHYQQLNTGILQIENEFYSTVRPKRTAMRGETALRALFERGVEYVEVRCVDLNPFEPLGINAEQIRFIDTFLVYCALAESPLTDEDENRRVLENQQRMVYSGRDQQLALLNRNRERPFKEWANQILDDLAPIAQLLDDANASSEYQVSLNRQREKVSDAELTPSAQVLQEMRDNKLSFFEFGMMQAKKQKAQLSENNGAENNDAEDIEEKFRRLAEQSIVEQRQVEAQDESDFDAYLKQFYDQYQHCRGCD